MQTFEIKQNTDKLINFVSAKFENGELDNESILELFKVMGKYLNLQTIQAYANENNLTYQGVKVGRKIETIFGVKFVIENE